MTGSRYWSDYWRSGQTESCFGAAGPVDTGPVWAPVLAALPEGARVIDLGCGAGALARRAVAANRGFIVTGADYAEALPPVEGVDLHENAALEALPFADAAFDAALSQFGFEYAGAARAAPEAARILAPGGRLALLVHAAEGPPVQAARRRLEASEPLIAEDGLAHLARRLGEAAASGAPQQPLLQQAQAGFAAARQRAQDETSAWALGFLAEILNKRMLFPPDYLIENAGTVIRELTGYCARLRAMTAAALTRDGAAALCGRFKGLGLEMDEPQAARAANGDQVGWLLTGGKPG